MKIAIGTLAPPKVLAIEEAINSCPYFEGIDIEFITQKVASGISDMPISIEENIKGAKNRAHNLKKDGVDADFYIGMEGGTGIIENETFLFGVVHILDKNGNENFGISNMMIVPEVFRKRIYENGEELGPILSELTGVENASKKNGAFGAWSDDMLTRKDQFVLAFLGAVTPFFNNYYKM